MADAVADAVADAIAETLRLRFEGPRPPQLQLIDALSAKAMLLILDNYEHLAASAAYLSAILQKAPAVQIVVTSRLALEQQEEWRFPLTGLALPPEDVELPAASDVHFLPESMALFVQCARRIQPEFSPTPENWCAIAHICRYVYGRPLGIELAASWLVHMSCAEIADEIRHGPDFLDASLPYAPERHRNMRVVFEYSWRLLSPLEQQTLMEMTLFRGGCTRQAAQAITGQDSRVFMALLNNSMLQRSDEGRWMLHELLRQFCLEKLDAALQGAALDALRHSYSVYYLALLRQSAWQLKGYERKLHLERLRPELDNIRQAWRWTVEQADWPQIGQTAPVLAFFYTAIGLLREGSNALAEAVSAIRTPATTATEASAPVQEASVLLELMVEWAVLEMAQANYANALTQLDNAEELLMQLELSLDERHRDWRFTILVSILVRRAETYWYRGEMELAEALLVQVAHHFDHSSQTDAAAAQELRADQLCLEGLIAVRRGDYHVAIARYDQSHQLSLALGDAYRTCRVLYCLGTAYRNQAHYGQARRYLLQGLEIAGQTGDFRSEGRILNTLGDIELYQGDYLAARTRYESVAHWARLHGDRRSENIAQTNLGIVQRDLGYFSAAERSFQQSRAAATAIGFQRGEGWNLCCLSLLYQQVGDSAHGLVLAQQAVKLFDQLGDRLGQAHSAANVGRALVGLQRFDEAMVALQRALRLRLELRQPHLAAEMHAWLATATRQRGDAAAALAHVQNVLDFLANATLEGMDEPARVCQLCAQVLQECADAHAADLLAMGRALVEQRARSLTEPAARASYLQNVRVNKDFYEECA